MDSSEIFSSKTLIGELGMFSDSSADTRCSDDNNIDKTNVDIIHIDNTFLIICFINSYLHLSISYLQLTISYEIFNFLSIVFCIY